MAAGLFGRKLHVTFAVADRMAAAIIGRGFARVGEVDGTVVALGFLVGGAVGAHGGAGSKLVGVAVLRTGFAGEALDRQDAVAGLDCVLLTAVPTLPLAVLGVVVMLVVVVVVVVAVEITLDQL